MFELILIALCVLFQTFFGDSTTFFLTFCAVLLLSIPGIRAMASGAPYVPTFGKTFKTMLRLAEIKPGQVVYDLGCGDGRLVFAAAAQGATAIGYELSVPTFLLAKLRSLGRPRVKILFRDFWKQDYRQADVVFCYLLIVTMQRFEAEIWPQLKPGCRVVSHAFSMNGVVPDSAEDGVFVYVKR